MRNLKARLRGLEAATPPRLHPAIKAWLGQPVAAAELAAAPDIDLGEFNTGDFTQEEKSWLGIV